MAYRLQCMPKKKYINYNILLFQLGSGERGRHRPQVLDRDDHRSSKEKNYGRIKNIIFKISNILDRMSLTYLIFHDHTLINPLGLDLLSIAD